MVHIFHAVKPRFWSGSLKKVKKFGCGMEFYRALFGVWTWRFQKWQCTRVFSKCVNGGRDQAHFPEHPPAAATTGLATVLKV